jgi:hypothetical protein
MRSPATEWLEVWEQGLSQTSVQRALSLLAVAYPDMSSHQLVNLSIGQRDGLLLTLREQMFGSQIVSLSICPKCGDRLELTFSTSDIRIAHPDESLSVLTARLEDYEVQYRLPTSADLEVIGDQLDLIDLTQMRQQLLNRCLLSVCYKDKTLAVSELPASVISMVLSEMAQADPLADIQLLLSCPACEHQWQATFDVVSFFWAEIHAWARRLLQEVHILASAYSWREADILAMSSRRRRLYLEMIGE